MGTDRADTDLLVDDVHSAKAGEMRPGEMSVPPSPISTGSLDRMWHWSPGVLAPQPPSPQARAQPELSSTSEFTIFPQAPPGLAGAVPLTPAPRPCLCSPIEADLIETLFAGLVYGVEAGARVLLLMAVWVIGRIRLGAAAWGTGLAGQGGTPTLCTGD